MMTSGKRGWARSLLLCLLASTGCDGCGDEGAGAAADGGGQGDSDGAGNGGAGDASCRGPRCTAACVPGAQTCSGGIATFCRDDGTLARYECDPVQGLSCTASGCQGECDLSQVHDSYIGCDYYPTVTLNPVFSGFSFAVTVSNTSSQPARVTITRGDAKVQDAMVGANQLATFELPWVSTLKGGDVTCTKPPPVEASRAVADGAYRVRSDRPVTVYQFSPLQYELSPAPSSCPTIKSQCAGSLVEQCYSYSNDASLLLPATALTGSYTVVGWPSQREGAGLIAITATEDDTQVTLFGTGRVLAGGGIAESGSGKVSLDRGAVLELVAAASSDLTGTRVRADKPVQVISGHSCANVPTADTANCDHLEEVVFPEETLGRQYIVTRPLYADAASPSPHVVRIAAIADDTEVRFDPAVREPLRLSAGAHVELVMTPELPANVLVTGDKPIVVNQYMAGKAVLPLGGSVGDPSMSTAVALAQYRSYYLFTAPTTYTVNIATVIAMTGAAVTLDGRSIAADAFTPVGASGYGVANVVLDASTPVHELRADQDVGLVVYGYGQYTSYMYPGGADLERITVPPVI